MFARVRARLQRQDNNNASQGKRIARRRALISTIYTWSFILRIALFVVGYSWMMLIPTAGLSRGTWIDENALQPSQVTTYWDWKDVHTADRYLDQLEALRDRNASLTERVAYLSQAFQALGLATSTQQFNFTSVSQNRGGINVYASLSAPRTSGSEAIIISASWLSLSFADETTKERNLNLRGIAILLTLAGHLKRMSLWAKDLVFVVDDGHMDGMHAFLSSYHGSIPKNMVAEPLTLLSGGVIWTALCIDYPGHSFSHIGLFYEGVNARLPNQDLLNSVQVISQWTGGSPTLVYDHKDLPDPHALFPSWLQNVISRGDVRRYKERARNVIKHMGYQTFGRPSGVHGVFHQYRIDAITLYAVPSTGPHGFYSLGKTLESSLRTANNLLERLHASFFFYLLTGPTSFIVIGQYLTAAVLIGITLELNGLHGWVATGWRLAEDPVFASDKKQTPPDGQGSTLNITSIAEKVQPKWKRRRRPLLETLGLMTATHVVGYIALLSITSAPIVHALETKSYSLPIIVAAVFALSPTVVLLWPAWRSTSPGFASISSLLKALMLCIVGMTICITSVLNFSLAASLAIFLGVPLSLIRASSTLPSRALQFGMTLALTPWGLAAIASHWLGPSEVFRVLSRCVWEWEVLGVWFLPFMCVVYFPFVLQGGLVALLPPQ